MRWLFRCFCPEGGDVRGKKHSVSNSIRSTRRVWPYDFDLTRSSFSYTVVLADQDSSIQKRQLGSFFLDEDHELSSNQVQTPSSKDNDAQDSLFFRELKHEAALLKNCGAILQTPAQLSKRSGATPTEAPVSGNVSNCYFNSKIPDTSDLEILWDEKHELSSHFVQEQENVGPSQINCMSSTARSQQIMQNCESSSPSVSPSKSQDNEGIQIESVIELKSRFHNPDISLHPHKAHIHLQASVDSPFPTPLKVTNEMDTPATVYPTNLCHLVAGKGPRIETQYAYPLTNPVETLRWKLFNADSLEPLQSYVSDSSEEMQQEPLLPEPEELSITPSLYPRNKRKHDLDVIYTDKHISGKTNSFEMSKTTSRDKTTFAPVHPEQAVSKWLKPTIAKDGVPNETKENSYSTKSSDADRPILGLLAAHWKDKAPVHRSSKQWDGNGIPNSTNKYKEDQRVSWHATPFEERLEKALSDENSFPKRNCQYGKPLKMEDEELADTAAS
ncbi:uncharacterized protein LOC141835495 [Curcuma longa]|uniref:uncharacterized protein LOC141835495 n=1 Tax=Curcuma longa TaxID=136217 RepID=UPI003D9DCE40